MKQHQPDRYRLSTNLTGLTSLRIAVLALLVLVLLAWVNGMTLVPGDDLDDNCCFFTADILIAASVSIALARIPPILFSTVSIFARVVVYRGGRTNRQRFNDRTIEAIGCFERGIFKGGSIRSRLCFRALAPCLEQPGDYPIISRHSRSFAPYG